jgi:hypothetical protein
VNVPELVVAAVLAALGVRSAVRWARRPFAGRGTADHLLYALHVAGRVGLWFAFAGIFLILGTSRGKGAAFGDERYDPRWLLVVVAVLGAMQLLGGWFLARREDGSDPPAS